MGGGSVMIGEILAGIFIYRQEQKKYNYAKKHGLPITSIPGERWVADNAPHMPKDAVKQRVHEQNNPYYGMK